MNSFPSSCSIKEEISGCTKMEEIIFYLSKRKKLNYNEAESIIDNLQDRFGSNAFQFIQYLNVATIGKSFARALINKFDDIPLVRELSLESNINIDEEHNMDIDDSIRKVNEKIDKLKEQNEILLKKLRLNGLEMPKEK